MNGMAKPLQVARCQGATMVETALAMTLFLFIVLVGISLSLMMRNWSSLLQLSVQVNRDVMVLGSARTPANVVSRINAIASGHGIEPAALDITFCSLGPQPSPVVTDCPLGSQAVGESSDYLLIKLEMDQDVFGFNPPPRLSVKSLVRNEQSF